MPGGRRKRWGQPQDEGRARRIDGFMEPCLLLLLHHKDAHGYELLEGLSPFGFGQQPVNLSTVYRLLRDLEGQGLVTSQWDTTNPGPARRIYQLTETGALYLQQWVEDLQEADRVLHHFLQAYNTHIERHE